MPYQWKCPSCSDVVVGRKNPGRKNVTLRVCLPCVLAHGEMHYRERGVELTRRAAAKMVTPSSPSTWRGVDFQAEANRLVELEICPQHLRDNPITVRVKAVPPSCNFAGMAYYRRRHVDLFVRPSTPESQPFATLVHEIAHVWVGHQYHDDHWRMCAVELVREGYQMEPDCPIDDTISQLDICLEKALHHWWRQHGKAKS